MIEVAAIETERLKLQPLNEDDAVDLFPVLSDRRLHEFTGGEPATSLRALRKRFRVWATRESPDGMETWLNWVVRDRESGAALGYVQASISRAEQSAVIAWVIGSAHQGRGFAKESVRAMVLWLASRRITPVTARINRNHVASMTVARAAGLSPTEAVIDGEQVWSDQPPGERLTPSPAEAAE